MSTKHPRSSRQRYRRFVEDYQQRRLDDALEAAGTEQGPGESVPADDGRTGGWRGWRRLRPRGKRREYLREYLRWLRPLRLVVGAVFLLALIRAGLEMIEPLFMRFIVDRVLLNATLTP